MLPKLALTCVLALLAVGLVNCASSEEKKSSDSAKSACCCQAGASTLCEACQAHDCAACTKAE